jgi:hypothetical protein
MKPLEVVLVVAGKLVLLGLARFGVMPKTP